MTFRSEHDPEYVQLASLDRWVDLPVDSDAWDRYEKRLSAVREQEPDTPVPTDELKRTLLAAAVNTGAIEGLHNADRGLTQTAMEHAAAWQPVLRSAEGEEAEAHVAAALAGYELALDAARGSMSPSEAWIRRLHEVVCAGQSVIEVETPVGRQEQHFLTGSYKTAPNHVLRPDGSVHAYCPVDLVPSEMGRFINALNSESFATLHPAVQAAFAHHGLAYTHPFQDGNGRVARVLASVYLLRGPSVPLIVYPDQVLSYHRSLRLADEGRLCGVRQLQLRPSSGRYGPCG